MALATLVKVAIDDTSPHQQAAINAYHVWRDGLATNEQVSMVDVRDDLDVNQGAFVSEGDGGFWVQTWTWIPFFSSEELNGEGED